jgi:hypothetical protein
MRFRNYMGKALTLVLIATLFASVLAIPTPVKAQADSTIVFDISHGQEDDHGGEFDDLDVLLEGNLTAMGYTVVWAAGGINSTILADADALIIGSIFGPGHEFLAAEVTAITEWFNGGNKFLWVGYDSDYTREPTEGKFINDESDKLLEAVGSHVYGEPSALYDEVENVDDASYRPVANETSDDPFVADIVAGVTRVMFHSGTVLYGSDSTTPGVNVEAKNLEANQITNVYPLLYSSNASQIQDGDDTAPYAHDDGATGSFVIVTLEINAGTAGTSVIVVSGSNQYGGYHPLTDHQYEEEAMNGYLLVKQAIDWGINRALNPPADYTLLIVGVGVAAVVIIIVVFLFMRRK